MSRNAVWLATGFVGQTMFTMRFIVQWLTSERAGRSVTPVTFWYFSLLGGIVLLSYAIWRRDPVFISGQALGLLVYVRNLQMISRDQHRP